MIPVWAAMLETLLIQLHKQGILMVGGTDAIWNMGLVPGFSLLDELAYFVRLGLTPYEALKMCTVNAGEVARRMKGLKKAEFGTIETGMRADLILLDRNPLEDINHIRTNSGVMTGGRWFSKKDCAGLLAFDEDRYQAYLDLFECCRSMKKRDVSLLDDFIQKTKFEDIKRTLYKHRDISAQFIRSLYKNDKMDRVKEFFNNVVKSNWDDANFLNAIAWNTGVEMKIGAVYPDAVKAVRRALELHENAGIYDTLAWLYALNGDYENALNAIDEAKRLDPDNNAWDKTREKIIQMKNG
jgi:tetratricopeptide (TPR) repeat protein